MLKLPILTVVSLGIFSVAAHRGFSQGAEPADPSAPPAVDAKAVASPPAAAVPAVLPQAPLAPQVPVPKPEELIDSAIGTLERRASVVAKLHVQVNLYGQEMIGSGTFLALDVAHTHRSRFEVHIQHAAGPTPESGPQVSTLMWICDGRRCWSYRQLFTDTQPELTSYDVTRIARAIAKLGPAAPPIWPLPDGLVRLLRSLRDYFVFDQIQPGFLSQTPVWRVEGHWRPEILGRMLPDQAKTIQEHKPADLTKLSVVQPDYAALYLGQDDLFPRRLECGRRNLPKLRRSETVDGQPLLMLTLHLTDIVLDAPLDAARFDYSPADLKFPDQTDPYLHNHGWKD